MRELGIPRSTFYNWYRSYVAEGFDGLEAKNPERKHYWNKIPEQIRGQVIELALEESKLSPRELACKMTDEQGLSAPHNADQRTMANGFYVSESPDLGLVLSVG